MTTTNDPTNEGLPPETRTVLRLEQARQAEQRNSPDSAQLWRETLDAILAIDDPAKRIQWLRQVPGWTIDERGDPFSFYDGALSQAVQIPDLPKRWSTLRRMAAEVPAARVVYERDVEQEVQNALSIADAIERALRLKYLASISPEANNRISQVRSAALERALSIEDPRSRLEQLAELKTWVPDAGEKLAEEKSRVISQARNISDHDNRTRELAMLATWLPDARPLFREELDAGARIATRNLVLPSELREEIYINQEDIRDTKLGLLQLDNLMKRQLAISESTPAHLEDAQDRTGAHEEMTFWLRSAIDEIDRLQHQSLRLRLSAIPDPAERAYFLSTRADPDVYGGPVAIDEERIRLIDDVGAIRDPVVRARTLAEVARWLPEARGPLTDATNEALGSLFRNIPDNEPWRRREVLQVMSVWSPEAEAQLDLEQEKGHHIDRALEIADPADRLRSLAELARLLPDTDAAYYLERERQRILGEALTEPDLKARRNLLAGIAPWVPQAQEALDREVFTPAASILPAPVSQQPAELLVIHLKDRIQEPDGFSPEYICETIVPYAQALINLHHIIDDIEGRPPADIRIYSISHGTVSIGLGDFIPKTLEIILELIDPRRRDERRRNAELDIREKELRIREKQQELSDMKSKQAREAERAEAEIEKTRAETDSIRAESAIKDEQARKVYLENRQLEFDSFLMLRNFTQEQWPTLSADQTALHAARMLPEERTLLTSPLTGAEATVVSTNGKVSGESDSAEQQSAPSDTDNPAPKSPDQPEESAPTLSDAQEPERPAKE